MAMNDCLLLLRKEKVGWAAILSLALGILMLSQNSVAFGVLTVVLGYFLLTYWFWLDASYRGMAGRWAFFALVMMPVALVFYLLSRTPVPVRCYQCGGGLADPLQICPTCGRQTYLGQLVWKARSIAQSFSDSMTQGPTEQTAHTAKFMAIACAAFVVFGLLLFRTGWFEIPFLLLALATAAYWVLTAWWVYLDASWRRMDGIPWAILTLVTNLFGLVTYLVVRYPDPKVCPQCGAGLALGIRCCPYCGAETERTCPRCQAAVQPDWAYCPSCAAQLPVTQPARPESAEPVHEDPRISIRGTVVDGNTGTPIPGASITLDSRTNTRSASTDPLGRFVLMNMEPRPYVLIASAEGYAPQARPFTPRSTGSDQVHFALFPSPVESSMLGNLQR